MTILFVDLVGSTPLAETIDPEAFRRAMDSFYLTCTDAILKNGGVPEKFIGDAVMAVFGAYRKSGDEAVCAVATAVAVRSSLRVLNAELSATIGISLEVRCGIQSGEAVVIGSPLQGEPRVVGDVVNTAARLQSAAGVNEILIGDETALLVGARLLADAVRSIRLKGKQNPVRAHSVRNLLPPSASSDLAPMLGRDAEVTRLHTALAACQDRQEGRMVVFSGPPGIGKSRIVREFLAAQTTAQHVLRAICQDGPGMTYLPVADLVRCLPDGWQSVVDLLGGVQDDGARAVAALAACLDLKPDHDRSAGIADIAWAVRCLFTALAEPGPLIVVLEDLHYAAPTFLDLIREAVKAVPAAVLVVCTARPDLFLVHPDWERGLDRADRLELGPLTGTDIERLLHVLNLHADSPDRLARETLRQIAVSSAGNPLYAELLLAASRTGKASTRLPTMIRDVLEAWLDRLAPADQEVLRKAATIGPVFCAAQLLALDHDPVAGTGSQELKECLERLLRSGTLQPTGAADQFHFTQSLVRETLYETTAKSRRARWHLTEADRLAGVIRGLARPDLGADNELARHLELAYRWHREVQPGDSALADLAERTAQALIRVGSRALRRKDLPAAVALLERGRDLVPAGDERHRLLAVRISDVCAGLGAWRQGEHALMYADGMLPGDLGAQRLTEILRQTLRVRAGLPLHTDVAGPLAAAEDDLSRCRFLYLTSLRHFRDGRFGASEAAMSQALARARALDPDSARYEADRLQVALCELTQWSPTHIRDGLALCAGLRPLVHADRTLLIPILLTASRHHAMGGELAEARAILAEARSHIEQLQLAMGAAAVEQAAGFVEGLDRRHALAARHYRAAAERLDELGLGRDAAVSRLSEAREAFRAGEVENAAALVRSHEEDDVDLRGRLIRSALKARLSAISAPPLERPAAVWAAAEEAISALPGTDDPVLIGDVWFDLALAMGDLGNMAEAEQAAEHAAASYLLKGASLLADQVRERQPRSLAVGDTS